MQGKALSYSSLDKFNKCALQFQRMKATDYKREALYDRKNARGTIIHRFMQELINNKILQGKWMSEADAVDLMNDLWTNGFPTKEDASINILEAPEWGEDNFLPKSIGDSVLFVPQIYQEILPALNPVEAEAYRSIPLVHPGKQYTQLHGEIDLINNPNGIIDWKTVERPRRSDTEDLDIQATVYAAISGFARCKVHFVQFVFLKRDEPRIQWNTTSRDSRHIDWLMETYLPAVVKQIEADIMPPSPGWHCDWCNTPCGIRPGIGA